MTFVSMPEPLMFLPMRSTINRSMRSNGRLGSQSLAWISISLSASTKSAGATARTRAVRSYWFSTMPKPKRTPHFSITS